MIIVLIRIMPPVVTIITIPPYGLAQILFFFSIWVFFHEHSLFTGQHGKGEGYLFNSSLLLPPASQTLRNQPGNCCIELTSAHSQQPDSSREPLVSEHKSLTTKLCALNLSFHPIFQGARHHENGQLLPVVKGRSRRVRGIRS